MIQLLVLNSNRTFSLSASYLLLGFGGKRGLAAIR